MTMQVLGRIRNVLEIDFGEILEYTLDERVRDEYGE